MGKKSIKHQSLSQAFYKGELDIKTIADKQDMSPTNIENLNDKDLIQEQQNHAEEQPDRKVIRLYPKVQAEHDFKTTINPLMRFLSLKSLMLKQSTE